VDQQRVRACSNRRELLWLQGAGRRLSSVNIEELLVAQIMEKRFQRMRVTRTQITSWARDFATEV
jgi:hypothetical protein